MSESVNHSHDRFVRRFLGDTDQIRELIQWQLPQEVVSELDLETISPTQESFVDKTLRESLSDLVFEIQLSGGQTGLVTLLFEHKSTPDKMTAFQVLRYIVGIGDQRHRNGEDLCCVIPIVFYHGKRPWNVARTLPQLIDAPAALKQYIPNFSLPLVDLSVCSEEELRKESLFFALMQLLKYMQDDALGEKIPRIFRLFRQLLPAQTGLQSLEAILRYMFSNTDQVTYQQIQRIVKEVWSSEGESLMPTIAQQLREQGIQQGREQGIQQGREQGIQQGREQGIQQGREQGIQQGREQGIQQGREQGIQQGQLQGRIRTLQEVLGRPVSTLEELNQLNPERLQQLADELNEAFRRS